jgi:hypothetical protein
MLAVCPSARRRLRHASSTVRPSSNPTARGTGSSTATPRLTWMDAWTLSYDDTAPAFGFTSHLRFEDSGLVVDYPGIGSLSHAGQVIWRGGLNIFSPLDCSQIPTSRGTSLPYESAASEVPAHHFST